MLNTKVAVESLALVVWNDEDKALGLPSHVRECVAAEYGRLSASESTKLKSSFTGATVKFGETQTRKAETALTPALHLLALVVHFDAVASKTVNLGMVVRIKADELPTTVQNWIQERRNALMAKKPESATA